ncbi:MAG: MutS-related protein [Terriglobia bacterium]
MSVPDPLPDPGSSSRIDPRAEYSHRLESTLNALAAKERLHIRAGNLKLLTVAGGAVIAWLVWADRAFSAWWLIVPIVIYAGLAVLHGRVLRARARLRRVAAFYRRGLARIDDEWAGTGDAGERFRNHKSVYAEDIDIFGNGSLFELLSTARTPMGENKLAGWLLAPSSPPDIIGRHALVDELRGKLDLRERISVAGEELRAALDPDSLGLWAALRSDRFHPAFRIVAAVLAPSAIAAFFYALATYDYVPLLIILGLEAVLMYRLWKSSKAATLGMGCGSKGLALLAEIIEQIQRVEQEKLASARLQKLAADLRNHGQLASRSIRRLATLADWIDGRDSMFVKIIEIPLLYTVQVGLAAEHWRRRWGGQVARWMDAVAEAEALLSLATYSFEHPEDPFPEFAGTPDGKPFFEAEDLGHPLIPSSRCVRNSVRLGGETQVLMVSGSNMSGKSTLLRAVGINTVLAMMGAPVRAHKLRLSSLALGTRIRTTDSLQDGQSRFYAEILRIRQVLDLTAGELPLLFLFDELLEGTNSKDRRIGAEGLVRSLISRRAIGMVTTHDLALTAISSSLGNSIHNAHFQEHIEGGKMSFDYKLREGVVETSNALELMRWIGLDV